jgi:MGT family glycosyltransferase
MRILFCPLATHGFVHPAIAIAQALQRQGHQIAFATGASFEKSLAEAGIQRIPCGRNDRPSFQVERWHHSMAVAMQVKHIEYALKHFAADVLVTHPLSHGALIVGERAPLPVAVVGLLTYLWPVSNGEYPAEIATETETRLSWRHDDMLRHYNEARALFNMPICASPPRTSALLGDLFMLQSVSELGVEIEEYPPHVHLIGSCLWESGRDDALKDWVSMVVESGNPLIYVHHGRSFSPPSFWTQVKDAFKDKPFHVVAAIGRFGSDMGPNPQNFFVRPHLNQGTVLPHARVVVSGGNTSATLGALTHGLPCLFVPGGGEQADVAEQVVHSGAAKLLRIGETTAAMVEQAVEELLERPKFTQQAQVIAQAFARARGPERAAFLIEQLGRSKSQITRDSIRAADRV